MPPKRGKKGKAGNKANGGTNEEVHDGPTSIAVEAETHEGGTRGDKMEGLKSVVKIFCTYVWLGSFL